ncbi:MAG TPA: class I SAM-dependent methyltransferase, partial [Acidimicrobiales bacterium]
MKAAASEGPTPTAGWSDPGQVEWYLDRIDRLPPRLAGENALAELLPPAPETVLDLGCGDGRLAALVLAARPAIERVLAVDVSDPMLHRAEVRFAADPRVTVGHWDLADSIEPLGSFDLIVSGFAIHHLEDDRKQRLFTEIAQQLVPGGIFANLE